MHQQPRLLSALWVATVLTLFCPIAFADDEEARSEAAAHLLQAELALQGSDFLEAAREYRKAAQASNSVDIARQATRVGYSFGFNDEALLAAKRWLELDEGSDEALLYVAQLQLRLGDLRTARRNFKKLIERGDEDADQRLLSLVQVLSEEDPEDADKVMRWLAKPYKKSASRNTRPPPLRCRPVIPSTRRSVPCAPSNWTRSGPRQNCCMRARCCSRAGRTKRSTIRRA